VGNYRTFGEDGCKINKGAIYEDEELLARKALNASSLNILAQK
jgi:hypothetical protein